MTGNGSGGICLLKLASVFGDGLLESLHDGSVLALAGLIIRFGGGGWILGGC